MKCQMRQESPVSGFGLEEAIVAGGPAGGALRINRLLEEAIKKSRIYLSGGCGPCEPFETRRPF